MPPKRNLQPNTQIISTPPKIHNHNDDLANSDEEDDGREICEHDERCYRKNPLHFKEKRHPKKKALEKTKSGVTKVDSPSLLKRTLTNEMLQVRRFIYTLN